MQLRILTPGAVVLDMRVRSLRGRDATGCFGIRPGHEPFQTCLAVSLLTLRNEADAELFVAVRRGVLRVIHDRIDVVTRDAVLIPRLGDVESAILAEFARREQGEAATDQALVRLQLAALRQLVAHDSHR
jgi:F-type H+-transporting ATPase subunit epsilon